MQNLHASLTFDGLRGTMNLLFLAAAPLAWRVPGMKVGLTGMDVPHDKASPGWDCQSACASSGTFVRQANGVVVPDAAEDGRPFSPALLTFPSTTDEPSSSPATPLVAKGGLTGMDVPHDKASPGWDCQSACTPSGTFVRQANGVVVPDVADDEPSSPAAPPRMRVGLTGIDVPHDKASLGWDCQSARASSGTFVRQANGVVVPTVEDGPSSPALLTFPSEKDSQLLRKDACSLGGGRVCGTFIRNANGMVLP